MYTDWTLGCGLFMGDLTEPARSSASIAAAQSLSLARNDFCSVVSGTLVA